MAAYNRPLIRHKSTSNYMKIVRRRRVDSEEVHRIIPSENMIGCIQSCTQRSRTSQTAISMLLKTGYQGADDRSQTPFVLIGNHLQITVLPETYLNNKQIFLKKSQKCTILYHEISWDFPVIDFREKAQRLFDLIIIDYFLIKVDSCQKSQRTGLCRSKALNCLQHLCPGFLLCHRFHVISTKFWLFSGYHGTSL